MYLEGISMLPFRCITKNLAECDISTRDRTLTAKHDFAPKYLIKSPKSVVRQFMAVLLNTSTRIGIE
eukprot:scaffold32134_cov29-Prasinocladus_malaysianus.AAC.1